MNAISATVATSTLLDSTSSARRPRSRAEGPLAGAGGWRCCRSGAPEPRPSPSTSATLAKRVVNCQTFTVIAAPWNDEGRPSGGLKAPGVGLEPTTYRLTADRSAIELPRTELPRSIDWKGDFHAAPLRPPRGSFAHSSTHFRASWRTSASALVRPPDANPKRFWLGSM